VAAEPTRTARLNILLNPRVGRRQAKRLGRFHMLNPRYPTERRQVARRAGPYNYPHLIHHLINFHAMLLQVFGNFQEAIEVIVCNGNSHLNICHTTMVDKG